MTSDELILVEPGLFRKECKTAFRRASRDRIIKKNIDWLKGYEETLRHFKRDFQFIPDKIEKGVVALNYHIYIDGIEMLHSPYMNNETDRYVIFTRIGQRIISSNHRSRLGKFLTRGEVY